MVKRLLLLAILGACGRGEINVGAARLAVADGTVPAPEGPLVEVGKDQVPARVSGVIRIAADREVPYSEVIATAGAVKAAGGRPVLLVARRTYVEALPDPAPPDDAPAIKLEARVEGKACISPPDNDDATCVSRQDQKRIDRSFVRQLLAKAARDWGLRHVRVIVDPALPWADAVRAIDGARTCCGKDAGIVVHVEPTY